MNTVKGIFIAIGLLVAVAVIGVAGWQFDWWLQGKNVDKQVHIVNRNKGVQTAWRDEARNAVTDFYLVAEDNTAARGALRVKACDLIDRLVTDYRTDDLARFENKECN